MGNAYASRRRRRCSSPVCAFGGRIAPGDRVVRLRQRQYLHEADLVGLRKTIEVLIRFDWGGVVEAMRATIESIGAMLLPPPPLPRPDLIVSRMDLIADDRFRVPNLSPPSFVASHMRVIDWTLDPIPDRSPDSLPFDLGPDRCWRCDDKPGMEELDGACWRCHYELTGKPAAP